MKNPEQNKAKFFTFNTGRKYANEGQFIGVMLIKTGICEFCGNNEGTAYFNDYSRGISGKVEFINMDDSQYDIENSIMRAYDNNTHSSWYDYSEKDKLNKFVFNCEPNSVITNEMIIEAAKK